MNLKDLPKDIEDIILNYKYQLENTEKYDIVVKEVREIYYKTNPIDNCCSFVLNIPHKLKYTTYHIKFCRECGKYYRSNIVVYKHHKQFVMRYSYYNSFITDNNANEYVIHYGLERLNWRAYFKHKKYNKHISCSCLADLF